MDTAPAFKTRLRNLEAARRNYNPNGRNAESSRRALDWRYDQLAALARTDVVCDLLDNNPTLAARWNRAERHHAGLPA